jgi:C4-dicarboxylate-specific signal transduction histidine kinase
VILFGQDKGVIIQIGDNGPGLSEEALQRVFHPFFTTKASGMGIGLSISHSIVQSHKGTMRVFNKDEGGAVFELCLPYAKASA